jgi:hypothetical protein
MSALEIDGMKEKALGDDQDAIAQALSRAVARVRLACRTAGATMGVAGTIPEELIPDAMDMAAFDVLKRLNVEVKQDRRDSNAAAAKRLESVARKELTVLGDDDDETENAATTPKIKARSRTLGREYEVGL